jgi:hypothetical protein
MIARHHVTHAEGRRNLRLNHRAKLPGEFLAKQAVALELFECAQMLGN